MIDIQTLIGSFVAIAAALIGFWGVIYSQRKLARMAREDQAHQLRFSKEQAELERRNERQSFLNAIVGELSALQFSFDNAIKILQAQTQIAEELLRLGGGRKTQPRVAFHFQTPVFDNLVSKIGLLTPEQSFALSRLYGQIKSYSIQSQDQVPEMEPSLAARIMQSGQESMRKLSVEAEAVKKLLLGEITVPPGGLQ